MFLSKGGLLVLLFLYLTGTDCIIQGKHFLIELEDDVMPQKYYSIKDDIQAESENKGWIFRFSYKIHNISL